MEIINWITIGLMAAGFLTFAFTFLKAFLSKDKSITINIDNYKEGNIEVIFVVGTLCMMIVSAMIFVFNNL